MKAIFKKDYTIKSLADTKRAGKFIAKLCEPGALLLFYGSLGSGKTTLIKEIFWHFGVKDVSSPTFIIADLKKGKLKNKKIDLVHIDCYRLKNENELLAIGAEDFFRDKNILTIEWPQNARSVIKKFLRYRKKVWSVEIKLKNNNSRQLKIYENML